MSIARHHAEWLSLVEVSGLFLSMPALLRVFPQGLHAHDPEVSKAVRRAHEEWQDNQQGLRPDLAIHTAWVRFVLREVLGFPDELIWGSGFRVPATLVIRMGIRSSRSPCGALGKGALKKTDGAAWNLPHI